MPAPTQQEQALMRRLRMELEQQIPRIQSAQVIARHVVAGQMAQQQKTPPLLETARAFTKGLRADMAALETDLKALAARRETGSIANTHAAVKELHGVFDEIEMVGAEINGSMQGLNGSNGDPTPGPLPGSDTQPKQLEPPASSGNGQLPPS